MEKAPAMSRSKELSKAVESGGGEGSHWAWGVPWCVVRLEITSFG